MYNYYHSDVLYIYDNACNVQDREVITVPLTHQAKQDFYTLLDVERDKETRYKGTDFVVSLTNPLVSGFIGMMNTENTAYPILTAMFYNLCNIKNPNTNKETFKGFSCGFGSLFSELNFHIYPLHSGGIPLYKGLNALKQISSLTGDCSCFKDIYLNVRNNETGAELQMPIANFLYAGNIEDIYEKLEIIGWKDEIEAEESKEESCVDQPKPHFPSLDFRQVPKTFEDIARHQIAVYELKNADYGSATGKLYERYGITYYMIMLEQKMLRIQNLLNKGDKANNESIEDSLLDLSNYAILAVESLRNDKKQETP